MQVYFIRHAQSENNALWDRTGSNKGRSNDPALTALGQTQAGLLANFLKEVREAGQNDGRDPRNWPIFPLTHIYCSLMIRSVITGLVVAKALALPLVGWKDLHEGGGIYLEDEETDELVGMPGTTRPDFERLYPELILPPEVTDSGWWNRPFENREERNPRAHRVLAELHKRHGGTDDRVALISHGGFYQHFLAAIMGLQERAGVWFYMNNAAVTRFDFSAEEVSTVFMNRTDALTDDLLT
jgi:2,3-bisphosphoglycerate-dependent phosphoglycerate mutase